MSDVSIIRKQNIKPILLPRYAPLCAKRTYDKLLFGNDLGTALKEADDESKISKNLKQNKFHPYSGQNGFTRPRTRDFYTDAGDTRIKITNSTKTGIHRSKTNRLNFPKRGKSYHRRKGYNVY